MTSSSRNGQRWVSVEDHSPCPVCGKPDWCRVSHDGQLAACRRESRGAAKTKTDKSGGEVYLHRLTAALSSGFNEPRQTPTLSATSSQPQTPGAKVQVLDRAYLPLLSELSLNDQRYSALLGGRRCPRMTLETLLAELDRRSVALFMEEGRLRFRAPAHAFTVELRSEVARYATDIIGRLRSASTCLDVGAAGCGRCDPADWDDRPAPGRSGWIRTACGRRQRFIGYR
jgi:hypothetical protein